MNNKFEFNLPARAEYLSLIRLTTSAIASSADFSIDLIEDLKVCVSEVCNIGIKSENNDLFKIVYKLFEDSIEINFLDFNVDSSKVENIEMSKLILQTLIKDISFADNFIKLKLYK